MNHPIPYGKQSLDQTDIDSVVEILRSQFLTCGPTVELFEEDLAHYFNSQYVAVCSSGTSALHLAMLAIDVGRGDAVILPSLTFVATANAALYCGGTPIFVDIDPKTGLISIEEIVKGCELAQSMGLNIKAIAPVNYAGYPTDIPSIMEICQQYDAFLIEDSCHSLGAEYSLADGTWVKSGYSLSEKHLVTTSFHPVKHITTGEGGCVATSCHKINAKIKRLRSHGIERDRNCFQRKSDPGEIWKYEMQELGYNYRMSDIGAALGRSQLTKLNMFIKKRREVALKYDTSLKSIPSLILPPIESNQIKSSWHLYVIRLESDKSRLDLLNSLRSQNIYTQVHYIPVHSQPYYRHLKSVGRTNLENTNRFYDTCLSIPIFPDLNELDQNKVIDVIHDFFLQ